MTESTPIDWEAVTKEARLELIALEANLRNWYINQSEFDAQSLSWRAVLAGARLREALWELLCEAHQCSGRALEEDCPADDWHCEKVRAALEESR